MRTTSVLTLAVVTASAFAVCGCSDSGSKRYPVAAATAGVTSNTSAPTSTTGGTGTTTSGSTPSGTTGGSGSTTGGSGSTTGGSGSTTGGSGSTTGGTGTTTGGSTSTTPAAPPPPPPPTPENDPPVLTLTSPLRGQFMTTGQVLVEGNIADASGLAYFLIDGAMITPDPQGNFQHLATLGAGLNVIEIEAADPWANQTKSALPVISGQFLPETSVVTDALAARLNRPAFDAIEQIAAQQLGGVQLGNMIMQQNPLYSGGGSLANVQVDATNASFGTPLLDLDPQQGGLFVRAEIPNVDLTVRAHGRLIGIPYSVTTNVTATNAVVEGLAVVNVSQGQVTTQLTNVNVDLQGFRFDVGNVPGFLENLARSAVRRLIERQVQDQVEQIVPREINNAIAGANGPITQTVMGQPVTLHLIPTAVSFDPDGCSVLTDGDMVVTPPAGLSLPTTPGSFATPGAAPAHGLTKAIYLSANDDLLNRIGHAAWRGGMMHMTIDQAQVQTLGLPSWLQLDAFLLTIFFPSLAPHLNPADPLEIEISAATPPIFQTQAAPSLLEAGLGDLTVSIYVAPAGQPRQLVMTVGTQVRAEVGVSVTASNLDVDVIGRPDITSDVFATPVAPLDEVAVENLMDFVLPPVIQLFANSWSGFPLPTYPGINPTRVDVHQDGPALDFVTLEGDL